MGNDDLSAGDGRWRAGAGRNGWGCDMTILIMAAFCCLVWGGAMTVLYAIATNDVRRMKEELADQERRFTSAATIEEIYQWKMENLIGRLRMAAPWMLQEGE